MDRITTTAALLFAVLCGLGIRQCAIGVYGTRLPLDVKDLTPIQPQLDKLKPDERELVVGYLKRSNGDVLPARFADPDAPFTARTFSEAIALQRDWLARDAVRQAKADALAAEREQSMQPLRAVLDARLVRRQILTHDEIYGLPEATTNSRGQSVKHALNSTPALVVTWRLRNLSPRTIASAKGLVQLRDANGARVNECWFDQSDAIPGGESVEIRCGDLNRTAGDAERAFVNTSASDLILIWEPDTVVFDDGTTLKSRR